MNPLSGWPLWATIPIWIIIAHPPHLRPPPAILTRMTGAEEHHDQSPSDSQDSANRTQRRQRTIKHSNHSATLSPTASSSMDSHRNRRTPGHLPPQQRTSHGHRQGLTVGTDPDTDPLDVTDHKPPHKANNAADNSTNNKDSKDNEELPHHLPTAAARFAGWTFASESTDNTDILTTGTTIPEHVFGEQGRSILQLRGEEDLTKLANFHNAHTETVAAGRLKPTPVKSMLTRTAAKDVEKVLDMQSRAGAWKRRDDAYTLTFWGAYVLAWTHLPPMSWLYWLKMRRFAKMLATQRPELRA